MLRHSTYLTRPQNLTSERLHAAYKRAQHAISMVNSAVMRGALVRPLACPQCGSRRKIEAHHADYDKPLDVIWLCKRCHAKLHVALRFFGFSPTWDNLP
jgi:hypothetical protein